MSNASASLDNLVGLFYFVRGNLLLHTCTFDEAEPYGDFLNYPLSHDKVWQKNYRRKYGVDFDYYPRGRIIYNKAKQEYMLYYDGCIEDKVREMKNHFIERECQLSRDEHYQCHTCCKRYVR